MSKKHSALFDEVLSELEEDAKIDEMVGARFLKRSTTIGERISGQIEEKTLRWVDPAECRMWERHNRDYALLNEENCRDLIDGIRSQGKQEFPAIVRRLGDGDSHRYEVICGARRHFAVSWLNANNYKEFRYLVEVRDLDDEEAFRLADIENRDREDISDYERAIDYADAVDRFYGGRQKAMAARLNVSEPWLSRYLQLAKLPEPVVAAFASKRDLRERHARDLKPLLSGNLGEAVLAEARAIAAEQETARAGQGAYVDSADVIARLIKVGKPKPAKPKPAPAKVYSGNPDVDGITLRKKGKKTVLEFDEALPRLALEAAFRAYIRDRFKT
ncbi:ParB/RepB/Spo0J family partition protein [Litorisediminicola beolgyonensis]|uniref:ParB/RepB/Spo0J family partition protein n=1 Tax=Litorisediminicola beolgyonensis TaxID=1173614 RepID=A0ABW3ZMP9_9RHOB